MARLADMAARAAERFPGRIAVTHGDISVTYADLWARSLRFAGAISNGLPVQGERVGLLLENSTDYVAAFFAAAAAGAVVVPLDTSAPAPKLREIVDDCQIRLLIGHRRFRRTLVPLLSEASTIHTVFCDGTVPGIDASITLTTFEEIESSTAPFHYHAGERADLNQVDRMDPSLAAIFYTSGSTGQAKGVKLSHRNLISNTVGTVEYLRLTDDDSILVVLPFYYIYGNSLMLTHVDVGGRIIIDNQFMYVETVLDTMAREKATGFSGVPSSFSILLNNSSFSTRTWPHLRYVTQAGGGMAPELIRRLIDVCPGKEIYIMYGQTEASPRVTWLPPERLTEKLGSIGIPVPGVEVSLVSEAGEDLGPGQEGEIVVGGPGVMLGYWNQPEEEAEVLRSGRLFTGDLARRDIDGYFFIVGRRKEIIKAGGNRVSAKEVEECLLEHPAIIEAAVIGVPDEILGESIKAVVVPADGAEVDLKEIQRHCRQHLADHKIPRLLLVLPSLPKRQTGKIDKHQLRALHKQNV